MKKNKKANIVTISALITLIIGLAVITLVQIFTGTLGGKVYNIVESDIDEIGNNVVTADSFTSNNGTAVSLDHAFIQTGTLSIYNDSAPNHEFGLGNFTIDYDAGTVLLLGGNGVGATPYNDTTLKANYTWGAREVRNYIKDGVVASFDASKQTAELTPIVAMAFMIVLILSMIVGLTAIGGGMGRGGGAL